jgi:hypothetical protein
VDHECGHDDGPHNDARRIAAVVKPPVASLLILAALAPLQSNAQGQRKFTGVITDSMCATGDHSRMRMGPTDGECTIACVLAHGALYVLYDGTEVYTLSDQKTPEKFAGKKVTVRGALDAKTKPIHVDNGVDSILAAK